MKIFCPFMAEDVKKASINIRDLKLTGPDGLHAIFYKKKLWNLCDADITHEVLQALNSGVIPDGWKDMTLVLIPKGR
jgi:hypothetical protein